MPAALRTSVRAAGGPLPPLVPLCADTSPLPCPAARSTTTTTTPHAHRHHPAPAQRG
jgi:hypothetical protein